MVQVKHLGRLRCYNRTMDHHSEPSLANRVEAFAASQYAFDRHLVWAVNHQKELTQLGSVDEVIAARRAGFTISVKAMEKFNQKILSICDHLRDRYQHDGPLNCSVDICQPKSPALEWHNDPEGTWIKVLSGSKTLEYDNGAGSTLVELKFDDDLYLSPGSRFRAVNKKASVVLIVKLGRFMEDLAL